ELPDDREVVVDAAKLIRHAHAYAVLDEGRAAFRVERDEVERCPGFSGGVVRAGRRVLQERAEHCLRAARHLRTPDSRGAQGAAHAVTGGGVRRVVLVASRPGRLCGGGLARARARRERYAAVADVGVAPRLGAAGVGGLMAFVFAEVVRSLM